MNRVICLNVNNIIGTYLNTRLYKRMKQNWKQRRREIRNYMERIRIGSVADLPNRRYFFDGGWSSGRRILSTHRSGWPGKRISRSRLIHARGDAVGRWKFQSAISIVTRGEARSRRTAKRLSISCKSTTGIAGRGAPTHPEAGARARAYRLLVIKMLTPAVRLPKCTGYCGFFEHRSRKRSAVRENFLSPNTFFLFSSYNIELMKTCLSSLFFFPSRKKENDFELERFFLRFILCYWRISRWFRDRDRDAYVT